MTQAPPRPKALLLEDDPTSAALLAGILESIDIESSWASTSHEFIEQFKKLTPDICFVDLNVDRLGVGFQVIEALRRARPASLGVFVVSSNRSREAIAHALEIGADDFITKPLDRDILVKKLSRRFTTEPLSWSEGAMFALSARERTVELGLDCEIKEIDELGLRVLTRHLPLKGQIVRISGMFAETILGTGQTLKVRVTNTSIDPATRQYLAELEFDESVPEIAQRVRQWVISKLDSKN